jgi:hypothetical protein
MHGSLYIIHRYSTLLILFTDTSVHNIYIFILITTTKLTCPILDFGLGYDLRSSVQALKDSELYNGDGTNDFFIMYH